MLTDEDIKNLTEYQLKVFKRVFVTKDAFNRLISKLQSCVDKLATQNHH